MGYLESLENTLVNVLELSLRSPQTFLGGLNYLSDRDMKKITAWNPAASELVDRCVHDVIYERALERPQHEAVCAWDGSLTYRDLWVYVHTLAQALVKLGVGPGEVVPLCFEKSTWSIVAMLAILEAGAAFCPLDASQPSSRLERLVSRLGANVLLCSPIHSQKLSPIVREVLPIDAEAFRSLSKGSPGRLSRADSQNVAYVLWTSGSTGEPKGVVIEHRAYCSAACTHAPAFGINADSRVLQYASYVFDASILECLTTLMVGATVCIPSEHARLNDLPAAINDMRVDWTCLTPSVINFLNPSMVPGLKSLLLMGEVMSQEHISTWSSVKLLNAYGPAECSVAATANPDVSLDKEPTLIGRAIGVQCWLVDPEDHNRLLPPGCVAELVVEGPTLARGYLNDPEKTRQAFVENPAWALRCDGTQIARRMYKTGDLVRYHTTTGMLYFMGRKDAQVKLHGQRVELGEIEHHLKDGLSICQSMVLVPKAGFCQNRLVAVISTQGMLTTSALTHAGELRLVDSAGQGEAEPIIAKAREKLSSRLPAFMVPSIWLVVDRIPLLKSGKLDRKAVVNGVQDLRGETYAQWIQKGECEPQPANDLENRLRSIWGHVLNLRPEAISLKMSFLALSGDSISAMMVQSHCKKSGIRLSVQQILRSKSIADLAKLAQMVSRSIKHEEKVEEDFDLSPIQSLYFSLPRNRGHFNQSVFVRLTRPIQPTALRQATRAIVNRHSMLRARFRLSQFDGEWKQRITTDVAGSHSYHTHKCRSKEEALPIMSKTQASLDPVNGPLFVVNLFEMEDGCQLLFMTAHHLVIDLVSWRVILQDIEELLTNPKIAAKVEPSLAFQSWCAMQFENAHKVPLSTVLPANDVPAQSFSYWGIDDSAGSYGEVNCEGFELGAHDTAMITSGCHATLRTDTVDVLIASMLYSFSRTFTDRVPATIFNEGHGREVWDEDIDLSRTVGWFTTMYPVHVSTALSGDFTDVLRRVKDYRRALLANGRPYFASRILTSKGAKRFGGHWPLEMTFNYLGIYQQLERDDGLLVPAEDLAGEARAAGGKADVGYDTPRFGLFEVSAVIAQGMLRFSFTFNRHMKHQDKIRSWISTCRETLLTMPPRVVQMSYQPTLSDFPLLSLTYDDLERLTADRLPRIGIHDITNVEDIYRCSQIQQGLLISRQRDAGFYAIEGVYKVNSKDGASIDGGKVAAAWQTVVDRHASLRTIFIESLSQEETLYDQIVLKKVTANIVYLSRETDADAIESLRLQPAIEHDDRTPSHRFTICETPTNSLFCKLEISHTIIDGTSMSIIFRELASLCEGRSLMERGPLYSDYISFLQTQSPQAGIGYWKNYLVDAEPTTFPKLDDAACSHRELHSKRLQLKNVANVQAFCALHGLTMANIFHTAWALTLKCYTGSSDVSYGYLMSVRDQSINDVDSIVGYLVNMLVCRVVLAPDLPLIGLMQQVQTDLAKGQAHSQTALSQVLHTLHLSGGSLFNTSLSYRKIPIAITSEQHTVSFDECFPYYDPTEYSVSVNIEISGESAAIDLDYWTDCLSDGHATNVAKTFLQAVTTITEQSELVVGLLNSVSDFDLQQILKWNSSIPNPINRCVHEVVARQTKLDPDAPALRAWDGDYTYAELDAASGQLANYLSVLGVGPESYVCLCFEKSAFTIIGMLGVLQAGGAFVSLDPMHPAAALEMRVRDTQAEVILTSPCYSANFAGMGLRVVSVDQNSLHELRSLQKSSRPSVQPENACCVIYTSGSTGKPKGVVLEHRALVTSSNAHGSAIGVNSDTRFLQFASYTFDNSLEEIFTTLMRGGVVCVPSDHDRFNDLAGAVSRLGANFMDLTPTVATYLNPAEMPGIKGLVLGGEAVTKTVLQVWGGAVEIHNMYGPSECSINSTHRRGLSKSSDPSNIGRSIGSVSWIVDATDSDRLVAVGCEGELLIEGPILARGYLNNPEKTTEVFIKAPAWALSLSQHGQNNGSRRMYKTGDLVRYNSDGTLCYIGRKDQQIKLNGQRIELGEIEYHVRTHLEVDWHFAVELTTPGSSPTGTKALALFVCPEKDSSVSATVPENGVLPVSSMLQNTFKSLEESLVKALPKHMVPTLFIPVARLPLTSSGKLDRKQLHAIAKTMTENQLAMFRLAGSSGRTPESELERTLAGMWESTLNLPPESIGMDAQYFRLGGDSVAAIRLVSAARTKGISLTVADIFRNATLSQMCDNASASMMPESTAQLREYRAFDLLPATLPATQVIANVADLCKLDQTDIEDIYPCASLQEGLIALSNRNPGAYVAQNVYRLPSIDVDRFKRAWQAVVAVEPILRTRIVYTESFGFLQVVVRESIEWLEYSSRKDVPDSVRLKPAYNGGGLTEYSIVREYQGDTFFVYSIHHALFDGWSIELLMDKVKAYYNGYDMASPVENAAYSRFIQYLSSEDQSASDRFWQARLEGTTSHQFPMLPQPNYQPHVTGLMTYATKVSRQSGADLTMPSLIRAAWALTVSAFSNSEDVVFAETVNGRDAPVAGILDMIGPTFATVPVRIQTTRGQTVKQFLGHLQDDVVEAMPHQYTGLQRIKRISPDAARACELQNLITIHGEARHNGSDFWKPESKESVGTGFYSYALTLDIEIAESDVRVTAHFDPNVLPEWQCKNLLSYFGCFITRFSDSDNSCMPLESLRAINEDDETAITQWNETSPTLVDKCIHDLVQDRAKDLSITTQAICSWDAHLTYRELDDAASCLANRLQGLGVSSRCLIPICFEKSALTVIVMLGVLKIGASFVALDGESPATRLGSIISDVDAKCVLSSPKFENVCRSLGIQTIVLDLRDTHSLEVTPITIPLCSGRDIAYAVFTSGSTGKPKGTPVSHSAFLSSAAAHGPAMRMHAKSRVLQFASYTFDVSVGEIFTTLTLGGCVCIPDEETRLNDLARTINEMGVTWAFLTPSVAQTISPSDVPALETLVLGGEAATHNNLSTWARLTHLVNGYGPSECSVICTVNPHLTPMSQPTNIGYAVGGRAFIVNQHCHDELVPIGAIGELAIAGPNLAQGYLKNPAKTEESFVGRARWMDRYYFLKDPANNRMYKTGDLVKYDIDGSLVYVGRKDNQTKLHGQRLELGEVEHHVSQLTSIQHCLTAIPTSGPYEKKLVGIVSFRDKIQSSITDNELDLIARKEAAPYIQVVQEHLVARLPPYMVPSNWVVLQKIPLLPSGKLDRKRISLWIESMDENIFREISRSAVDEEEVQGSDIEQRLQSIWARILHLSEQQVGFNQGFLALGGDSISALQVLSRCRTEGLGVTVKDIIRCRSISELATRVTLPQTFTHAAEEYDKPFDLSPIQRLFFDWVGDNVNHLNQSISVRLNQRQNTDRVSAAIKSLVIAHSMLRARFEQQGDNSWTQRLDKEASKSYRFTAHPGHHSLQEMGSTVGVSQSSLNIQKGPLFTADLFEADETGQQVLTLVAHHLVIDIVSWGIILDDLEDLLASSTIGTQATLPYQVWSRLQAERTSSETSKGSRANVEVPAADFHFWSMSQRPNVYRDILTLDVTITTEATSQLLGPCNNAYQTETIDILLGSILYSFCRAFPDREAPPAVFNEGHGREPWDSNLDLTHTVGWFTTVSPVVLPAQASQGQDIAKVVRWVKDQRSRFTDKGRQYFARRMLAQNVQDEFSSHWPMEVAFNYLGHVQSFKKATSILQPLDGPWSDHDIGSSVPRMALFEISASVVDGRLKISFDYNRYMEHQSAIHDWVTELEKTLMLSAEKLVEVEPQTTLSNFPLLPMAYGTLDLLQDRLLGIGITSMNELEDVYGCSPMQQGLLLSQIKDNGQYMYQSLFSASSLDPVTPIDPERLAQAWRKVVQKHTSFRTVFMDSLSQEGVMDQAVLKRVSPRITWISSDAEKAAEAVEDQEPISFAKFHLPHALTICTTNSDTIFCKLEMSHAICDGTSIPIVFQDLAHFYIDQSADGKALSYRDYISYIQEASSEVDISYWRSYLEFIEPCSFPALGDSRDGFRELLTLELKLQDIAPLKTFCSKKGVTLSNVLQLVWALVLRAYTCNDSVCFGYLTSGRNVSLLNIESAVGLFISMLVCRIDCSQNIMVSQALEQIRDDYAQSTAHQAFSLAELQHKLQLSGKSLFNTAFTFQRRVGSATVDNKLIKFDILEAYDPSEYDLTVNVEANETDIIVDFNYWTNCLSETEAVRLSETFSQILDSILNPQNSEQTIGSLDLCSESHRQQVLRWNQDPLPLVNDTAHNLIERRCQLLPSSAPAICSWDVNLSYERLISLSKRLAKHLAALGVGPEVYVPICFEKTTWAVVAILGILQAGGAFVPLEPSHPKDRIKYILNNVNARLVLSSEKYSEKFKEYPQITTFVVDGTLNEQTRSLLDREVTRPSPESAAYLIFTSGTTGLPKGTIIPHRAFTTSAAAYGPALLMRQNSRVLQFASLCFDASIMEILTTLTIGGCICIPSEEERMNDIPGAINRMSVNWTFLTPSVASVLKPESIPSLRVLVTGGEAMKARDIAKWQGRTSLLNGYGPTETVVIAITSLKVDEIGRVANGDAAVIGHAVGCRSWVVSPNDHNQLMPIGSVGELVIQGNNVSRGYLNMEEKTAQVFVAPPAWMRDGNRSAYNNRIAIYKTGDLVRYKSDGSLAYVSRKDTQIKLNGLRIELGEIEHRAKEKLPESIQTAVEMVAPAGQQQLLALFFSWSEDKTQIDAASKPELSSQSKLGNQEDDPLLLPMSEKATTLCKTLKADLAGALPAYMIPTFFVPLYQLPWTSSGKLDRRRLCGIASSLPKDRLAPFKLAGFGEKRAPTTEMETRLQALWEAVLNLERGSVTLDDGFFVLGGDSVAAMRLVAGARAELILLSVLDVFRKPTLFEMAKACSDLEEGDEALLKPFGLLSHVGSLDELLEEVTAHCEIHKDQVADAYPCTALQEGLMTMSIKQPGAYVAHNIFPLPDAVDMDQFKSAWGKAIDDMEILRTRVVHTTSSGFVQVVLKRIDLEWHNADRTEDVLESPYKIPEHNGSPLMRLTIVKGVADPQRYLVWSIQHCLYDGWSMPKILQRVEDIYFETQPPSPKASYSHFIRYLSQIDPQACNRYWQARFHGLSSSHFPTDSSPSTGQNASNELLKYTVRIPERTARTGITLPTIIRAAWGMVMSAHTGSPDVVFGETMTGRDVPIDGIIDILGPTITTVPTRIQINPAWTITELLKKVHEAAAEVIPYQHVGLQNIRRLNTETAAACDFQNLLVIQTAEASGAASGESKLWNAEDNDVGSSFFTYPLVLECNTEGSSIYVDAHYNDKVISRWHVQRLLYQLESVLGQLASASAKNDPKLPSVQMISGQDVIEIREWNNYKPSPVKQCIHGQFLRQVNMMPHANAVAAWDGDFTYSELKKHAINLAKHLARLGVLPEVLVPFCMDKSRWALVAQMGILLAGGAIVPLDPAHPVTRHSEIIKDTKATILLCSPAYVDRYSDMVKTVIPIDQQSMARQQGNDATTYAASQVTSKNTAYVIFTSGSTGRPKGVVVEHEAFCSSSEAYSAAMLMDPRSRVFNFASVTFDVGLMENLSPLTMGACVCVPNNEQKMTDLAGAIDSLHATWAFLTPSVANLIEPKMVRSLKVLVCGGEAMSKENILKWADQVSLVNGYGPTEAAVISVVNSKVLRDTSPANIGFAHANGYAWISEPDNHHRLAPLGCVGELLLEGPLLAREYLHDEGKTAKSFIDNPAWSKLVSDGAETPRRIYKTGDLVKYNEDGTIHFIGRKDNQIKLHGQRMELGEIEHNLSQADQIQHAVALLPKTGFYKQRLVAVVSMSSKSNSSDSSSCIPLQGDALKRARGQLQAVRDYLSDHIPSYMMPTFYVAVEAVPIMVSGKLDRKQVEKMIENLDEATYKQLTGDEEDASTSSAVPITETIQKLREVWAPVFNLPVDKIDPARSFMSQGGDSLVAMSIIARCRKIGITFSLQEVLQSKSLSQLAKAVEAKGTLKASTTARAIEKVDEPFDLSPVQRMYFQLAGPASDHANDYRFNQSALFHLKRNTEANAIQKAVEVIVQQHSMFRARFYKDKDGSWHQKISADASTSYRFRTHEVDSPNELLRLLALSQRSLDIENGPLFAVELFNTDQYGQVLSLIAHHLVIDIVSWGILNAQLEDMLTFQTQIIDKPMSYQVWCAVQHEHANQRDVSTIKSILPFNVRRANMAFWGMTTRTNTYGETNDAVFDLDKTTTDLLVSKANNALRTQPLEILITVLLSSFAIIFPERPAPTLYNETHGRDVWDNSIDITGTTGWFTSIYPITIPSDEGANSSAIELLKRAKDLRRSLPGNGREYFAHRYLTPDGRWRFSDHMPMEILLNYAGQSHQSGQSDILLQPFELAKSHDEAMFTADVGSKTPRMSLFEVSVSASSDAMHFSFIWNKHMKHQEQIRQWIARVEVTLKDLVRQLANTRPEPTLSDYPLLPTDYKGLQQLCNETLHETGISSLDEVEEVLICSPMQEGLLLAQLRNPQLYVNFVVMETMLAQKGAQVDVQRLARAWQKVVDRHQTLRTAFVYSICKDHAFDQIVLKKVEGGARVVTSQDEDWEKPLRENSLKLVNETRPIKLPQQLSICTTASGKCYTMLELNHAVIDGGSGALIMKDLALAYEGRLPEGDKPSYSEYIRYLMSRGLDSSISYWKSYLSGIQRCHLPHMSSVNSGPNRLNDTYLQYWRYPELQAFCRANELTMSNVMMVGWAFVLKEFTSQSDVCFGSLTAGREAPVDGIQDIVGAFINMLVCRVNFTETKTLKEIIRHVQSDFLDALEHQHCSLAKIQHDLGFTGKALFNSAISVQNQISSRDAEKENDAITFNPIADHDPTEVRYTIPCFQSNTNANHPIIVCRHHQCA